MRKKFLRAGAAVMAAVMALAMPITASAAEEGWTVAEKDLWYELPRCVAEDVEDYAGEGKTYKIGDPMNVSVGIDLAIYAGFGQDEMGKKVPCPAGYEIKSVTVTNGSAVTAIVSCSTFWPSSVEVQNSQGLEKPDDVYWDSRMDFEYTDQFSVNYNGKVYPECALYMSRLGTASQECYYFVVPQGFDGNIIIKLYGMKWAGDREVKDETTGLIYYLNGGAAAQPAAPTEQQPVVTQQPIATQQPVVTQEQQPTVQTAGQSYYTTKPGDNLTKIAQETYGDGKKWKDIYELNKGMIKDPNIIWSNMQLLMP